MRKHETRTQALSLVSHVNRADLETIEQGPLVKRIVAALRTCFDPEIPTNIYDLGLIYDIDVPEEGKARVRMTLTAPNCPSAIALPCEVETKVRAVEGVRDVLLEVVWDPPWEKEMMSEVARLDLGI